MKLMPGVRLNFNKDSVGTFSDFDILQIYRHS